MSSSISLRLELRPSRWLQFALCGLALSAVLAMWRSSVPNVAFGLIPVLLALSLWGLHRQRRGWLLLHADGHALWTPRRSLDPHIQRTVDPLGVEVDGLQLRGPLVVLAFRESGRLRRWCGAPDTLSTSERRSLRLWWQTHRPEVDTPFLR